MLETGIKYFALSLCSFYIYAKALNINLQKREVLLCTVLSMVLSLAVCFLRAYIPIFSIIAMTGLFVCFVHILYQTTYRLAITASVTALGISYAAFTMATVIIALPIQLLSKLNSGVYLPDVICLLCIVVIQLFFVIILFRFKRLKRGMPFLLSHGTDEFGVSISLTAIIAVSFFTPTKEADLVLVIPLFFILISGLQIFFWWRSKITKDYLEKTKQRELESLESELQRLTADNQKLAEIVHRDNKLIPAMAYAVDSFLNSLNSNIPEEDKTAHGQALSLELSALSQERSGILLDYERRSKLLPSTHIVSVDVILGYMHQKATAWQIEFDVSLTGNIKCLIGTLISEPDIKTLLADLVENAIIAAKKSVCKKILVSIGATDSNYFINVFDSGALFSASVLANAGLERTTTHRAEGGSGIGLMSMFEISRRAGASVVIDETLEGSYSKCVSVCFDNRKEYRIKTLRKEQIKACTNRVDLTFV